MHAQPIPLRILNDGRCQTDIVIPPGKTLGMLCVQIDDGVRIASGQGVVWVSSAGR